MRPERAVAGEFTRPVVDAGAVVVTYNRIDPRTSALRLGVNAGGHLERLAARLFPRALLVRTSDNRRLADLLDTGAAEAILTDEVEADALDLPGALHLGTVHARPQGLPRARPCADRPPGRVAPRARGRRLAREGPRALARPRPRRRAQRLRVDLDALLALIDLRLAFMPAIASAKQRAGHPVADAAQEARVLAAARSEGAARGLDPDAIEALSRAQIEAARTAQASYLAHPWETDAVDLEREARPALGRISTAIIARAADLAGDPHLATALDPKQLAETLDTSLATAPERLAIANALAQLHGDARRREPHAADPR